MYPASLVARKAARYPMSSGVPSLPAGIALVIPAMYSSTHVSEASVKMLPGSTALTVMRCGANSIAAVRMKAQLGGLGGTVVRPSGKPVIGPVIDEVRITRPRPETMSACPAGLHGVDGALDVTSSTSLS